MENILEIKSKTEFLSWLEDNYNKEKECYVFVKRGKPCDDIFCYIDAVYIALCYGWIDSAVIKIDGKNMQRFTPRQKNGLWTELNKERVRYLEKLGLMTDAGRKVLPDMDIKPVVIPDDIKNKLIDSGSLENFNNFPELYKRVRIYNLMFTKNKLKTEYIKSLENFIKNTKQNKMYGNWNDYGRLY